MIVNRKLVAVAGITIKGNNKEHLYAALCIQAPYVALDQVIISIKNIKMCGVSNIVGDINVYLGDQTNPDDMLVDNLEGWDSSCILEGIPYVAIHSVYEDGKYDCGGCLNWTADIEYEDELKR